MASMFDCRVIAVFDTELTAWEGTSARNWSGEDEHREIVQLGAVKVDVADGFREIDHFVVHVRPLINPLLSDYLIALTGITQATIDNEGLPFGDALDAFSRFLGEETELLCFNGHDDDVLRENCDINDVEFPFAPEKFLNLTPFFAAALEMTGQSIVSGELLAHLGLPTNEAVHTALGDSRIILGALQHIVSSAPTGTGEAP